MAATTTRTFKVYEETRTEWGSVDSTSIDGARRKIQETENYAAHKQCRVARTVDTVRANGNEYIITWYNTNPA